MGEALFPKPRMFTLPKVTQRCVYSYDTKMEESSLAETGRESHPLILDMREKDVFPNRGIVRC